MTTEQFLRLALAMIFDGSMVIQVGGVAFFRRAKPEDDLSYVGCNPREAVAAFLERFPEIG